MPVKRQRQEEDLPRTPKRTRHETAAAAAAAAVTRETTPGSRPRTRASTAAAPSRVPDSSLRATPEYADDDALAMLHLAGTPRSHTTRPPPSSSRKRNASSAQATPSASQSRSRKKGRVTQQSDSDDPAAHMILRMEQEEDDSDQEEGDASAAAAAEERTQANGRFEAYFDAAARKQATSNNTLSRLPALPHKEYLEIIKSYKVPYAGAVRELYASHVKAFPEWRFELERNYAICLTGYGSKKRLIEDFCAREVAPDGTPYVVLNGYHPGIDLRQICGAITAGLDAAGNDVAAVLSAVDGMPHEHLTLALHNLDGEHLRSDKVQAQIARMVGHPRIRMICSMDHVLGPLLLPPSRVHDLSLLFHDATTFAPYTLETELQADVLATSTHHTALVGERGIKWILQTLSQNARTIFRLLLLEQIASGEGMTTSRLFDAASAVFAVSNKTSFNAQLGEFLDHEIVVMTSASQAETLKIPFAKAELEALLENIDAGDGSE